MTSSDEANSNPLLKFASCGIHATPLNFCSDTFVERQKSSYRVYPVELVPVRHGDREALSRLAVPHDGDAGGGEVPVAPLGRRGDVGPARHRQPPGQGVRAGLETDKEHICTKWG